MDVSNDEFHQYLEKCRKLENNLQLEKQSILKVIDEIKKVIAREEPRFVGALFCKESSRGKQYERHQFVFDMPINALKLSNSEYIPSTLESTGCTTISPTPQNQVTWHDCLQNNLLSSSMVVHKFSHLVKNAIEEVTVEESNSGYQVTCRESLSFVSLLFKRDGKIACEVEIRPAIEVECWPMELKAGMEKLQLNGLPTLNVDEPVTQHSHLFLIPQHPSDGDYCIDSWQYDLTKAMKELLCSGDDCTKNVLLMLEGLISDLDLPGFRCFHIMNLMLHESGNHWHSAGLRERIMKILGRLHRCANSLKLPHFFWPKVNVLPALNQEQQNHVLGKLDKLLENPSQIIAKLANSDSCHV